MVHSDNPDFDRMTINSQLNGDTGTMGRNGDLRAEKRVSFLESDPHGSFRSRPSVPGPSAYETQPQRLNYMDSQFTENISRQMRVPDQIRPYEDELSGNFNGYPNVAQSRSLHEMRVPDRILVAGHDQHVGIRDNRPRELELDDMLYNFRSEPGVQVQTPPRTLTVDQHSFPAVNGSETYELQDGPLIAPLGASALSDHNIEEVFSLQAQKNMTTPGRNNQRSILLRSNGPLTPNGLRSGLPETPGSRLVIDLYKRVEVLERENHYRYLREMVGYAVVLGFVALKSMSFFLKR